jgi:hypothetical protein
MRVHGSSGGMKQQRTVPVPVPVLGSCVERQSGAGAGWPFTQTRRSVGGSGKPSKTTSRHTGPTCTSSGGYAAGAVVAGRTDVVAGGCVPVTEEVAVDCGEVVELRLVVPPCPTMRPRPARPALSVTSAGLKVIRGERLTVRVRAADACGNPSATCAVDPATTEDPGSPGLPLLRPPADARCPVSPCRLSWP